GETFVTRKVTRGLARIKLGLQDRLYLGNMNAKRDWGHARDYVEVQWLMLQQEKPEDFVIATGLQYSVREFVDAAAEAIGIKMRWVGEGLEEKGYNENGECIVEVDARYFRPTEVETLLGDASKAKDILGWTPSVSFGELVAEMAGADLDLAKQDLLMSRHGHKIKNHADKF
ncbi:MAG: GDP-mannose 4,6-dehydratase, partial [Burkholderiales bacterium]|nr:GDP-mannose 4,6-dehydratase [Burkholderiales bacterium]